MTRKVKITFDRLEQDKKKRFRAVEFKLDWLI